MEPRKPRHHSMPMTCKDKLDRVFSGEIRQTIRRGERYQVGDTLTIFEWTGKPYRSKWGRRIESKVRFVRPITIFDQGVEFSNWWCGQIERCGWNDKDLRELAKRDGVEPPTGVRLKEVLCAMHPDLDLKKGEVFQVVRW